MHETAPAQCDPSPRSTGDRADSWGTGQRSPWHTGHSGHLTPPAGKHSGQSLGCTERSQCHASHSHRLEGERRRECSVKQRFLGKSKFYVYVVHHKLLQLLRRINGSRTKKWNLLFSRCRYCLFPLNIVNKYILSIVGPAWDHNVCHELFSLPVSGA